LIQIKDKIDQIDDSEEYGKRKPTAAVGGIPAGDGLFGKTEGVKCED
jgi:hypothetical protein